MKNLVLVGVLCFLALLLPSFSIFAENTLRVGDPRNAWWTEWGSIEEATISTKPIGAYIECGLYLTFSAKGTQWNNKPDSLEITFRFELPEGALVHDSWLWIGNDIIKGKILDRWTASAIYEGYVRRRTDPSILFKNGVNQYELKVFPMAGNQKRRVKISYLVPARWSREKIYASLPTGLLKASRYTPKVVVLAWQNDHGKAPVFPALPGVLRNQNPTQPNVLQANINNGIYPSDITYDSPAQKGYYLSTFGEGQEGFYQVSFLPSFLANTQTRKKLAFLFDYDAAGGSTDIPMLLNAAKAYLHEHLDMSDSFNLILSNLNIRRVSDQWIPASYANIEAAFASAQNQISTYSNLPALLVNGIQFIKQRGSDGQLMVLSNASQFSGLQAANTLLSDIQSQMGSNLIPIHAVNYYSKNVIYSYINGSYYYGNAYFLSTLSSITKANYQGMTNQSLNTALSTVFNNLEVNIEAFDFHTKLNDGFCYGRFHPDGEKDAVFPNRPIVQIGKYKGEFPFKVEISGELNSKVVHGEISVPKSEVIQGDSLIREMWFGHYINLLETGSQQSNIIREIIETSIKERVLSRYTAFFCPEDTSLICEQCIDETKITNTTTAILPDSTLMAWPNPFSDQVTISIEYPQTRDKNAQLDIMTIDGRLIQTFALQLSEGKATLQWNGRDTDGAQAPAGVYLAMLKTGSQMKVLKLVKAGE
jgi:hypothetical protein